MKLIKRHNVNYDLLLQMLKDYKEVADRYNLKWCGIFGTLLGTIRDKDFAGSTINGVFVPHDFDIDLAVILDDRGLALAETVFNEMTKKGFEYYSKTKYPWILAKEGEWIDSWVFWKSKKYPGYYQCNSFPFHRKFFDELKTAKIRDLEIYIPNYAEEFLDIYYTASCSDWRKPDRQGLSQFIDNPKLYNILLKRVENNI